MTTGRGFDPGRRVGWRGNIPDGRTPGSRPSSPAAAALRRHTAIVPVPFRLAGALAAATGWLPAAPLTREEVRLLRTDKVAGGLPTPATFGVAARPLAEGLPASLRRPR